MASTSRPYKITKGPSKFDLMVSLFDEGGHLRSPRQVEFTLEGEEDPISVQIREISREDGSGESWNFRAWVPQRPREIFHKNRSPFVDHEVSGYFSTKTRTGTLKIVFPISIGETTHQ